MIIETFTALLLSVAPQAAHSQKQRCAHHEASGEMMCVERLGHCTEVIVDGHKTVPLTDTLCGVAPTAATWISPLIGPTDAPAAMRA